MGYTSVIRNETFLMASMSGDSAARIVGRDCLWRKGGEKGTQPFKELFFNSLALSTEPWPAYWASTRNFNPKAANTAVKLLNCGLPLRDATETVDSLSYGR